METSAQKRYEAKLKSRNERKALLNLHNAKNKMRRNPLERSLTNKIKNSVARLEKSGNSFETAIPMPTIMGGNAFDWDAPKANTFVIVPINNKKSSLHGRFVVLEKMENGLYKIAKKDHRKKMSEEEEKMEEKKRKIADTDLDKERIEKANRAAAYSRSYMVNSPGGTHARGLAPSSVRKMRRLKMSLAEQIVHERRNRLEKALDKWK
ncbi:MAG: hypothetical protein EBR94_01270 [Bacteroidetes bacterium]|nr:hypothetical protein [Bacteroidota bacterium]